MNPVEEMIQRTKKLRAGEIVHCKKCKTGIMKPIGLAKDTHCFVCDRCGAKFNMN